MMCAMRSLRFGAAQRQLRSRNSTPHRNCHTCSCTSASTLEDLDDILWRSLNAQTRIEQCTLQQEAVSLAKAELSRCGNADTVASGTAFDGDVQLKLNKIDKRKLLSPSDAATSRARTILYAIAFASSVAASLSGVSPDVQLLFVAAAFGVWIADKFLASGALDLIITDLIANAFQRHRERVSLHEAGHFLVGYGLGQMPEFYSLNAIQTIRTGRLPRQGGTSFCDCEIVRSITIWYDVIIYLYICPTLASNSSNGMTGRRACKRAGDIEHMQAFRVTGAQWCEWRVHGAG
jgi:hypothetical protein